MGTRSTAGKNNNAFSIVFQLSGDQKSIGYNIGGITANEFVTGVQENERYKITATSSSFEVDSTSSPITTNLVKGNNTMYLFATHQNSGATGNFKGKIYYAKFYKGETLKHYFQPVITKDGTAAMCDTADGNKLYFNEGTGDFRVPSN